jgi:hypothetical protein
MGNTIARVFLLIVFLSLFAAAAGARPPEAKLREMRALVVRADDLRDRTWVLSVDAVYLFEGERVRRFALPRWIYVLQPHASLPDLLVEPNGDAIVSSNITPSLWRIEPATSRFAEIPVALAYRAGRDMGFTALRRAEDGTLAATSTIDGSPWRIDLDASLASPYGR